MDYAINFAMLKKAVELEANRRKELAWLIGKVINTGSID